MQEKLYSSIQKGIYLGINILDLAHTCAPACVRVCVCVFACVHARLCMNACMYACVRVPENCWLFKNFFLLHECIQGN